LTSCSPQGIIGDSLDDILLVKPRPLMVSLHWWYHWKCQSLRHSPLCNRVQPQC